jgi:hypothetical protein
MEYKYNLVCNAGLPQWEIVAILVLMNSITKALRYLGLIELA